MTDTTQSVLDLKEAAAFCAAHGRDLSAHQLRRRANRGQIAAFYAGKKLVFLRSTLVIALAAGVL